MTHYTTIGQSIRLFNLGLSPVSADMEYHCLKETNSVMSSVPFVKDETEVENSALNALCYRLPCWSLEALLEAMPKEITDEYDSKGWLGMCAINVPTWGWIIYYSNDDDSLSMHEEQGNTLLEATYNMACWLLEEGYIKK